MGKRMRSAAELSDRYRIDFATWLFELRDADLHPQIKLAILNAAINNILHATPALLSDERVPGRDPIRFPRPAQMKRKRCAASPRRRAAFIKPT
jgi:hypothetical protein